MSDSILEEFDAFQDELNDYLILLSKLGPDKVDNVSKVTEIGDKICKIYEKKSASGLEFRHQYNKFLNIMRSMRDEDQDIMMGNIQSILHDHENNPGVYKKLLKLYDHIAIDITRTYAFKSIDDSQKNWINIRKEMDDTRTDITNLSAESSNNNIRMVTILGIFSAIVLSFTGGLSFISGSISGLEDVGFYKLLFVILLCGLVLYNVVLLLLTVVERAARFNLLVNNKTYKIMVYGFNTLILLLMVIDIIAWKYSGLGIM